MTMTGYDDALTTEEIPTCAIGDPHISSITKESCVFWKTEWPMSVQNPHIGQAGCTKLLIDGHVRPDTAALCVLP